MITLDYIDKYYYDFDLTIDRYFEQPFNEGYNTFDISRMLNKNKIKVNLSAKDKRFSGSTTEIDSIIYVEDAKILKDIEGNRSLSFRYKDRSYIITARELFYCIVKFDIENHMTFEKSKNYDCLNFIIDYLNDRNKNVFATNFITYDIVDKSSFPEEVSKPQYIESNMEYIKNKSYEYELQGSSLQNTCKKYIDNFETKLIEI